MLYLIVSTVIWLCLIGSRWGKGVKPGAARAGEYEGVGQQTLSPLTSAARAIPTDIKAGGRDCKKPWRPLPA